MVGSVTMPFRSATGSPVNFPIQSLTPFSMQSAPLLFFSLFIVIVCLNVKRVTSNKFGYEVFAPPLGILRLDEPLEPWECSHCGRDVCGWVWWSRSGLRISSKDFRSWSQ